MDMSHIQRVRILFKTILKLHRGKPFSFPLKYEFNLDYFSGLPPALQPLGNEYVRDEFKRHKNCNPGEANVFMTEWAVR